MVLPNEFVVVAPRERARPLTPDDRRESILDAVIPLLRERGRDVTSRELAEAAGVAEGTLFRAFGDKESLISAAIDRFFDPEPFRNALRAIDPDEPTVEKLRQVLALLQVRFRGVVGFMTSLRMDRRPGAGERHPRSEQEWLGILAQVFRPDELAIPVDILGLYLRLLAFGTAVPPFNVPHEFTTDELVSIVTGGVLATPPSNPAPRKKN